jgi:hypothetical protein
MAKKTLLRIVQDILSDIDGDEVNSINDSVEALQVASIVENTYYSIIDGKDWPWLKELFLLTGLGDTGKPSHLQIPEGIINVEFVKYNVRTSTDTNDKFITLKYKTPLEFVNIVNGRNSTATNVTVVTEFGETKLNITNDTAPQYWTSFDDNYIVLDSHDGDVDTTVQSSKTQCYGQRYPTFTQSDSFVPDLPVQMFSYLVNEALSTCSMRLKQAADPKAEQHSISQRRRMSQAAWKTANGITYPNLGRRGKK